MDRFLLITCLVTFSLLIIMGMAYLLLPASENKKPLRTGMIVSTILSIVSFGGYLGVRTPSSPRLPIETRTEKPIESEEATEETETSSESIPSPSKEETQEVQNEDPSEEAEENEDEKEVQEAYYSEVIELIHYMDSYFSDFQGRVGDLRHEESIVPEMMTGFPTLLEEIAVLIETYETVTIAKEGESLYDAGLSYLRSVEEVVDRFILDYEEADIFKKIDEMILEIKIKRGIIESEAQGYRTNIGL